MFVSRMFPAGFPKASEVPEVFVAHPELHDSKLRTCHGGISGNRV